MTGEGTTGLLADIVEVQLVGKNDANFFLGVGYRLLAVTEELKQEKLPNDVPFISRRTRFVVGRAADVGPARPQRWGEREAVLGA